MGVDDQIVTTQEIISLFSGPNCPALLNKPKVFFFQACRGSKLDSPDQVAETPDVQADAIPTPGASPERGAISTPAYSDVLNCFSTVEDYVSIRCLKTGSWFIQSICRQLIEGWSKWVAEKRMSNFKDKKVRFGLSIKPV